jgi:hypothetical protein
MVPRFPEEPSLNLPGEMLYWQVPGDAAITRDVRLHAPGQSCTAMHQARIPAIDD